MTKRAFNARPRQARGFYPTPWEAFEPLAAVWAPGVGMSVWEPCAGDGALCRYMARVMWRVAGASDVAPRHPKVQALDATTLRIDSLDDPLVFITNPPWPEPGKKGEPTHAIAKHLSDMRPTWLLLPADWMHNVCNADLMARCRWVVSIGRVKWIAESEHSGFDNCAWFLFSRDRALWDYPDYTMRFTPR